MDVKGQGALEYLLLIGGAVLVAAIVIALISGMPTQLDAEERTYCSSFASFTECTTVADVQGSTGTASGNCCAVQMDGSAASDQEDMSACLFIDTANCP